MSATRTLSESDKARFFRLLHQAYPFAITRRQKAQIWQIAQLVFERKIPWEEGLRAAGIPQEAAEEALEVNDSAYNLLIAIYFALWLLGLFGGYETRQEQGPSLPPNQAREFSETLRSAAPDDVEPEIWIEVGGKPEPVLGGEEATKPRKRRPRVSRKGSRTGTGGGPKRRPATRAKSRAKWKR